MSSTGVALRFVTYASIGALGTAAQFLTLFFVVHSGWSNAVTGTIVGAIVGAAVNYVLNRRITFRSRISHLSTLPRFLAIASLGVVVSGLMMKVLTDVLHLNYMIAQIGVSGVVLLLTFLLNSIWTFGTRSAIPDTGGTRV
ncbi:GtrA family protein [Paraburkholderia sp. J7]|uniref:GtrA family protein n=1 Tax=Paraburkholderia sp. J7 TaxID=2805438 RepID=UPI002AB7C7B0|nr:GtrA family protein [Paraburkholderia sp. J7]